MSKTINGTSQFLYDGLNPVQELNSNNVATANLLTGLNIDEFFSRTDSSGARSFLTDMLGSTLALTDSSGTIQTQYTYEPFGNVTVSGAANGSSYQFTGRENDGTGLYFYRARYYSSTFQRFIAQDPILFAGHDANLYAYVFNAPLNRLDPRGTQSQTVPLQPAPTSCPTPTPGGNNTLEIPPPWSGDCCCGSSCDNQLPVNTPDWEKPLITQLLDQNPNLTSWEAQKIIEQKIKSGTITPPGK